ncbi:hypothetical protein [Clostridium estertheticum]|uniref:Uncharacterized protein n=1 Tax=Clostridium estertheticum TaxID=238834 RepID=A0A7Y3STI2_9CLOT|nr:hypothetical protein [Clostridium estertheticum]NNU75101.1 hypothetical protein [Clostridium estertheticum]WBL48424.1 hypothetical protein LOR37_07130 [Clostridium estertheticum]
MKTPFIEISVRRENKMLLISFINPVDSTREVGNCISQHNEYIPQQYFT